MGQFLMLSIPFLAKSILIPISNSPWADCKCVPGGANIKAETYFYMF